MSDSYNPWTAAHQVSLSFTVSQSLLKLLSIELVIASNHLLVCSLLLLLPSIFPSLRVFSSELALHIRWPKYWSFSFSISPSNEYSGLISLVVVQLPNPVPLFTTPWTIACQTSLSLTISQSLPTFMSTELVMPPNQLILCHPLLLPPVFSSFRVFSNEPALYIRWPKYSRFNFSISPSNEYSGLISFRIDWFAPLAVQETLTSLL